MQILRTALHWSAE